LIPHHFLRFWARMETLVHYSDDLPTAEASTLPLAVTVDYLHSNTAGLKTDTDSYERTGSARIPKTIAVGHSFPLAIRVSTSLRSWKVLCHSHPCVLVSPTRPLLGINRRFYTQYFLLGRTGGYAVSALISTSDFL
jgi:hypothetical protein